MKKKKNFTLGKDWTTQFQLHTLMLPGTVCIIVFSILPLFGLILAFKNYSVVEGVAGIFTSKWYGFQNFKIIFGNHDFTRMLVNTLGINLLGNLINIPAALFFALLINEIASPFLKKSVQTLTYMPHFISWVVLSGILINMFASNGIVNQIFAALGWKQVAPLMGLTTFRPFIWISNIWKEFGWDSIIYMAALTGIDPQLYEAADIDGANRLQKMLHITWPGIRSTVCIMLILQIGSIMSGASFDQIFNLYSSPVYPVADTIDTYVYRQSFMTGTNFGYTTAIGLLKSVIGVIMIWSANKVTTKMGEDGLF